MNRDKSERDPIHIQLQDQKMFLTKIETVPASKNLLIHKKMSKDLAMGTAFKTFSAGSFETGYKLLRRECPSRQCCGVERKEVYNTLTSCPVRENLQ